MSASQLLSEPPNDRSKAINRGVFDDNLSRVWASVEGLDANKRLSVLLRLQGVWGVAQTTGGRLLRLLLVRRCEMPANSRGRILL